MSAPDPYTPTERVLLGLCWLAVALAFLAAGGLTAGIWREVLR